MTEATKFHVLVFSTYFDIENFSSWLQCNLSLTFNTSLIVQKSMAFTQQ